MLAGSRARLSVRRSEKRIGPPIGFQGDAQIASAFTRKQKRRRGLLGRGYLDARDDLPARTGAASSLTHDERVCTLARASCNRAYGLTHSTRDSAVRDSSGLGHTEGATGA
jgi:hypothetical protein